MWGNKRKPCDFARQRQGVPQIFHQTDPLNSTTRCAHGLGNLLAISKLGDACVFQIWPMYCFRIPKLQAVFVEDIRVILAFAFNEPVVMNAHPRIHIPSRDSTVSYMANQRC